MLNVACENYFLPTQLSSIDDTGRQRGNRCFLKIDRAEFVARQIEGQVCIRVGLASQFEGQHGEVVRDDRRQFGGLPGGAGVDGGWHVELLCGTQCPRHARWLATAAPA